MGRAVMIVFGVLCCVPGILLILAGAAVIYFWYFSAPMVATVGGASATFVSVGGHRYGPFEMQWVLFVQFLIGGVLTAVGACCLLYEGGSKNDVRDE